MTARSRQHNGASGRRAGSLTRSALKERGTLIIPGITVAGAGD